MPAASGHVFCGPRRTAEDTVARRRALGLAVPALVVPRASEQFPDRRSKVMETLGKKYSYGLHLIRSLLTYVTQQWPCAAFFAPGTRSR